MGSGEKHFSFPLQGSGSSQFSVPAQDQSLWGEGTPASCRSEQWCSVSPHAALPWVECTLWILLISDLSGRKKHAEQGGLSELAKPQEQSVLGCWFRTEYFLAPCPMLWLHRWIPHVVSRILSYSHQGEYVEWQQLRVFASITNLPFNSCSNLSSNSKKKKKQKQTKNHQPCNPPPFAFLQAVSGSILQKKDAEVFLIANDTQKKSYSARITWFLAISHSWHLTLPVGCFLVGLYLWPQPGRAQEALAAAQHLQTRAGGALAAPIPMVFTARAC